MHTRRYGIYSWGGDVLFEIGASMTIVAYHGTERKFKQFALDVPPMMTQQHSGYLYFTSNPENAVFYGPRVLRCELSLHNPMVFDGDAAKRMPVRELANEAVLSNFHNDTEYDGVIVRDVVDGCTYSDVYVVFEPEQARITGLAHL